MPEPAAEARAPVRAVAAGPGALYLYIDVAPSPETSRLLGAWRRALETHRPPALSRAIHDVIPGYTSLLIAFQPSVPHDRVRDWALAARPGERELAEPQTHEIAVAYGADADRAELEERLGLPFEEIVARHAAADYTVAFLGFTAGFPYLLGLPDALRVPRRARPRERIPAGAVAIAGGQAGIYPSASPGGWWVLGRTGAALFDPDREPPALLAPGDAVRFRADESALEEQPADAGTGDTQDDGGSDGVGGEGDSGDAGEAARAALEAASVRVTEAWPRSVSLQGPPRHGVGHLGMAEAGALDPKAYREANAILGNPADAVALEVVAQPAALVALGDLRAVVTGGGLSAHLGGKPMKRWRAFDWPAGTPLELIPHRDVTGTTTYLAVAGGFRAEELAGSGSTDVRAGVGGVRRFVAEGDRLAVAAREPARGERPRPGTPRYPDRIVLRIHPGPQPDAQAWRALLRSSFHVAVLDRSGARLEGPEVPLAEHDVVSEGVPAGSVQIPPDGRPIVLLADRGRTGGYAKPAIVDPSDLWQLAQAGLRTEVWFEAAAASVREQPVH